ncbi:hypothetical protein [Paenibacillus sp. LK1]|uniref:hypothetical protein n=1 Tax=Paenibacillus sp. LK1 TaxID=2053014 RepID=UPI000C17D8A8|nr:hypothetical protein [Paenibacillus sp. LK1]PIH59163.1 hypothetical protein CS562_14605 [Paenibacillus sp. LK1]
MTPFVNIYERFSTKIQDYMLDELFRESTDTYEDYIFSFLKSSIAKFTHCRKNLLDRDETNKCFNINLSELEEEILAEMMKVEWMDKEVNNVLEMRLALNNSDFKRYAESNNLKAKMDLRDNIQERVNNLIVQYSYSSYEWK